MRALRTTAAATTLALAAVGTAHGAAPGFVEADVTVIDVLRGDEAGDYFGWVAADVDDVDADGVDDFAVPAILDSEGGPAAGKVTVYSGATRTVLASHTGDSNDILGHSVSGAGDVDADGTPDYVAGGPDLSGGEGRVVVWSGADHEVIWDETGPSGAFWGGSVSGAGDLDADGHADIVVGAEEAAGGRGSVEVRSGADGSRMWRVLGRGDSDGLGSAVGVVGDVDGDGVPDLSVGAYRAKNGRGTAYVLSGRDGQVIHQLNPQGDGGVFGQYFASGAGDVDGDGVGDVFVGDYAGGKANQADNLRGTGAAYVFSGATGERIHRFDAPATRDGFGPGRGIGDVDGDGHADLVIAGYTSSAGAPEAGQATVYSGRDGSVLQTITSTTEGENFGVDALAVGDVDADGRTDFLVTAVGLAFDGTAPGTAYVVAGTTG
jgi:hypothetical protein